MQEKNDKEMSDSTIPEFKFALREDLVGQEQFLPTRGEGKASGWDVRAAQVDKLSITVRPGEYIKIPLGFRAFVPDGWWYELRPRSSSFAKKHLHALYGVIDEAYPNELVFAAQYLPSVTYCDEKFHGRAKSTNEIDLVIDFGDALGQIIPVRRQEMIVTSVSNEEIDAMFKERNAERTGGFGSTGK